jgi:uncharacterized protein (DUF58 family)
LDVVLLFDISSSMALKVRKVAASTRASGLGPRACPSSTAPKLRRIGRRTTPGWRRKVAASAHAALAELKPGDRAAVMIFWRKTELVEPFTGDLAAIEAAINGSKRSSIMVC